MIVEFCSAYGKLCRAESRTSPVRPLFPFSVIALLSGQIRCNNTDTGKTVRVWSRTISAEGGRMRADAVWARQRFLTWPSPEIPRQKLHGKPEFPCGTSSDFFPWL